MIPAETEGTLGNSPEFPPWMCMNGKKNGLFDSGWDKIWPEITELDQELIPTPTISAMSHKTSLDSIEDFMMNPCDDEMLNNWNEAFQDIAAILDEPSEGTTSNTNTPIINDELLLKDDDSQCITTSPIDLDAIVQATIFNNSEAFDLLDQLELLEDSTLTLTDDAVMTDTAVDSILTPTDDAVMTDTAVVIDDADDKPAVQTNVDHSYTQCLSDVSKANESPKDTLRRIKNNAASKVCRKQRKNKFSIMCDRQEELVKANNDLRRTIAEVGNVVTILREHLIKSTCKKTH